MIEATEIRSQGDIFDFLRVTDDKDLGRVESDKTDSDTNFSLHSIHRLDSAVRSDTEIKENA